MQKLLLACFTCFYSMICAQEQPVKYITMDEAVTEALKNNPNSKNAELKTHSSAKVLTGLDLGNTSLKYIYGQINSNAKDRYFEINQNLGSPFVHAQKAQYHEQLSKVNEAAQVLSVKQITADVKTAYTGLLYESSRLKIFQRIAPLYDRLLTITGVPYAPNDSDLLSRATSEALFASFQNLNFQAGQEFKVAQIQMQLMLNSTENLAPSDTFIELYAMQVLNMGPDKFSPEPYLKLYDRSIALQQQNLQLEKSKLSPEFSLGYFNQKIDGVKGFQGLLFGISAPLWFFPQKDRISKARTSLAIAKNDTEYQKLLIRKQTEILKIQLDQLFIHISYYRENALKQSQLLFDNATNQINSGAINYNDCMEKLKLSLEIQLEYLEKLKQYNQAAIRLESYLN